MDNFNLFYEGKMADAGDYFAPRMTDRGRLAWLFRVWAPNADSVSVVGDFNGWNSEKNRMKRNIWGIWELEVEGLKTFDNYKYEICNGGNKYLKADPYALHAETNPGTASKLFDISGFKWTDGRWMEKRDAESLWDKPVNIYEAHIGSWRRYPDGSVFNYVHFAEEMIPYLKEMGYTHLEIMPVTEYPYDGSWGYQITGMFAPTSRYGTPMDFQIMIDMFHNAGIGVILDWVCAHFPKDAHGLYKFDGTHLYEYTDPLKREHEEWGTLVFDYGRPEVVSFLMSSAVFFLEKYHIDGIRVDAVASMLYLDYARKEWRKNKHGGNHNLEAIEFVKTLNSTALTRNKGAIMIAEESTAFPMVTKPPRDGGLGFSFKWNMGWMNDALSYISSDPYYRQFNHNKMTFSLTYAFSENYILPLSHDEVVHGKCSLINKMPGYYADKFQGLKAFLSYYMAHPGKKLMFMGGEFAQFIEWDYQKELDWLLLNYDSHKNFKKFMADLNHLYKNERALYENDCDWHGFKWLVVDDNQQNILAFKRTDKDGNSVICVFNFSPVPRHGYKIGVDTAGDYATILNTEDMQYGGLSDGKLILKTQPQSAHGEKQSLILNIPGNCAIILKLKTQKA